MTQFNVIQYDFNSNKVVPYDVLTYFRKVWNDKKFNFDKSLVTSKEDLKAWIKLVSQYQFWSRCEYECLIAPWPYRQLRVADFTDEVSEDFNKEYNVKLIIDDKIVKEKTVRKNDGLDDTIKFEDLKKIDVHEQIMMNIDIITDILAKEFNIMIN